MPYTARTAVYATVAQLNQHGLPDGVLDAATADQDALLASASDEIDSYLAKRYGAPLTSWGDKVVQVCCVIAAWHALDVRGYNPDDPADETLKLRYDEASAWLEKVREGKLDVSTIADDSTPNIDEGAPVVDSCDRRGWAEDSLALDDYLNVDDL